MITELTKAIISKHGPFIMGIDDSDRFVVSLANGQAAPVQHRSFSIINCLIRLLAEDKINSLK